MRRRIALLSLILAAPVLVLLIAPPASGGDGDAVWIDGVAVTGANRLLGQPVWDVGEPFGGAGLNFVFGYNDGGSEPHDLTPSSPGDTLLATGVDPAMGLPPGAFDPALLNVPFRDVAVIVNFATDRAQVPSVYEAAGNEPSKSAPNGAITLDEWLAAEARLRIHCNDDGTADISLYTLWGVWANDTDGDGAADTIEPMALGGVPNAMVVDQAGKASMRRTLNFCPTEAPDLLTVNIAWHSDGNTYGAVPEPAMAGYPGGTVTHDQINFPINVAGEY